MRPNWEEIQFDKHNPYDLRLLYRTDPHFDDVDQDLAIIARAVVSEIVAPGQKLNSWVYVYARRRVKGETGQDLVATYGTLFYNPNDDGLHWRPGPPGPYDDTRCRRVR